MDDAQDHGYFTTARAVMKWLGRETLLVQQMVWQVHGKAVAARMEAGLLWPDIVQTNSIIQYRVASA